MSDFLLEIGTEELPADFVRLLIPQFKGIVETDLQQNRLKYGRVNCSSTPRRIVLQIFQIAPKADDSIDDIKGPPLAQAFVDGTPSKSAIGFSKRFGILPEDLEKRDTPKGPFVFAKVLEKGRTSSSLLTDLVPKWIKTIQGRRFMRWGSGDLRFSRPIRWLIALLDSDIIPITLNGTDPIVFSSNISRGHRINSHTTVIDSASNYQELISQSGVIVDREQRLNLIKTTVNDISQRLNSNPDLPSTLLDELTDIVESPSLLICSFDESFLDLPPEVLSTVMKVHQRYIPLFHKDVLADQLSLDSKSILLPDFLCVSNCHPDFQDTVKKGNQRVLNARFADAKFFINVDLSNSCEERRKQLNSVTFAEGLGSVLDRVKRIEFLVKLFINDLSIPSEYSSDAMQAAYFCKHDLVSQIVGEFPELQGVMGAKYLLSEGHSRDIAQAVLEQYFPRGSGDILPESIPGSILALADRLELLLSIFTKGERPSGSSDPYALRRAGNGLLQIIWKQNYAININNILSHSIKNWSSLFPQYINQISKVEEDLKEFFRQRILSLLEDLGFENDIIISIAGVSRPISSLLSAPNEILHKVRLLTKMRQDGSLLPLQNLVTRSSRLASKSSLTTSVLGADNIIDPSLFEKETEHGLLRLVNSLEPIARSSSVDKYQQLSETLVNSSNVLNSFFDGDQSVMVMTDNIAVRNNRLNLLAILRNQSLIIADFNCISSS